MCDEPKERLRLRLLRPLLRIVKIGPGKRVSKLLKLFCSKLLIPYTVESPTPPPPSLAYFTHSIRFPGSGKFGVRCFQKYGHSFNSERSADGVGQNCSFSASLQNSHYFFCVCLFRRAEASTRRARSSSHARRETPSRRASLVLRARLKKRKKQRLFCRLLFC